MRKQTILLMALSLTSASVFSGCQKETKTPTKISFENDGTFYSKNASDYEGDISAKSLLSASPIDAEDVVTLPKGYQHMKLNIAQDFKPSEKGLLDYEDNILSNYPIYSDTETIKKGSLVVVDETEAIGITKLDENKDYSMVAGNGDFIKEVDKKIMGHKAGDTITFEHQYSDKAKPADRAGKKVTFTIKIKAVGKVVTHEQLTDEMVKENFGNLKVSTKAEFETKMEKEYRESLKTQRQSAASAAVLQNLSKGSKIDVSNEELDKVLDERKPIYKKQAKSSGMSYKEFAETYFGSEDDMYKELREGLKEELILQKVISENNIGVSKKGYEKFLKKNLATYGYKESEKDKLFEMFGSERALQLTYAENLALAYLASNATIYVPNSEKSTTEATTESSAETTTTAK